MKAVFIFVKNLISRLNAEKICLFTIRWGIYLALFTPLIIHTKFFFPFVAPKTIFFRIIVEITLVAYIFLVALNRKYLPKITPLTIALTIFLEVFILASLIGVNFERSFWSTYERMTGLFTMLHLYAFFIILSSCFRKMEDWQKFFGVSVLAGVVLSAYFLIGSQTYTRMGGTIGNSSFMAAYLLFDIFFALILFLFNFLKKGFKAVFLQIFSGASMVIILYVLFNASARGALAAFEAGAFLMALGYLLFSRNKRLKQAGFAIILILIILTGIFTIFQPDFLSDKIKTDLSEMKSRFAVWQIGLKAWQEKFILGWGPENFYIPFSKYFNPCLFAECGREIWFDRAHNIIFDTAVTMGLAGLVSYLAIFSVAFWEIFRKLLKTASKRNTLALLGAAGLLFTYFGQNLLVFDMINTYLVFFLGLAFISSFSVFDRNSKDDITNRLNPLLAVVVILAMASVFWFGNIQPAIAAHYTVRMIAAKNIEEAAFFFQKSLKTKMYKYEAREIFAQKVNQAILEPNRDVQSLLTASELAEREMGKNVKENPSDFRANLFISKLYAASYRIGARKEKFDLAERYAEKAVALSPTSQQGYWQMGELKLVKGDLKGIDFFQKAIDLEPRYPNSHWYLAMAYKYLGQYESARGKLLELKTMGYNWAENFNDLTRAIEVFEAVKDYEQLIPLYQRYLEFKPNDIKKWGYLAASYYQLGQFDKAKEVALLVKQRYPELAPQMGDYLNILPH